MSWRSLRIEVHSKRFCRWGALALVALLCAPVSMAATYQFSYQTRYYASETVAGSDASVELIDHRDYAHLVPLQLHLTRDEANAIEQGDVMDVTFSLVNAVFAENVRISDLSTRVVFNALSAGDIRVRSMEGGKRGDISVTFELEATEADWNTSRFIVILSMFFSPPKLTGFVPDSTGTFRPVSVTAKTEASRSTGWIDTSSPDIRFTDPCAIHVEPTTCLTTNSDGVLQWLRPIADTGPVRQLRALVAFRPGIEFTTSFASDPVRIDLAAGRMGFTNTATPVIGEVSVGIANTDTCVGNLAECTLQSNGTAFTIERRGEAKGSLNVSVEGNFRAGDEVWLDFDQDGKPSSAESLNLSGSIMQGSFPLNDVVGNPAAASSTTDDGEFDADYGVRTSILRYSPNGTDPMRSGMLRVAFSVDFDRQDARDKPRQIGDFTMLYTGIESERKAHGIAAVDSSEIANMRIKCESSTPCTVYLECDDADGETWFAQLDESIAGRSTLRLSSTTLAQALGMEDASWSGRLSCTALSSQNISVQLLARSGNVLTNQTYIDK